MTKPFAFAVKRAPENGADEWRLFRDEAKAREAADELDGAYEGLYRVGDRRPAVLDRETAYKHAWDIYVETSMDSEKSSFECIKAIVDAVTCDDAQSAQVRNATLEECAQIAEAQAQEFLSPRYAANQPFGSICERFACDEVAKAIRGLAAQPPAAPVETETRFHTDKDREYAVGLLDDFEIPVTIGDNVEIATQWFCKARVETARRVAKQRPQCSAATGYDEPQGYAASLRQIAEWVREAVDPRTADSQRITLDDIDAEELDAAAAFIDRFRVLPQTSSKTEADHG